MQLHCELLTNQMMIKPKTMKSKFKLTCSAGVYESDSFFGIIIEVIKHRTWHLLNHGKWID